jgi:predicted permease
MPTLRDAVRALRATPLVTAVAILSLALGIGANTAMFSIVDALVLRALPVRHADRLTLLMDEDRPHGWTNPIWEAVRARAPLFDGALAYGTPRFDLSPRGTEDPVDGLWLSGRAFEVLGVDAQLGRTLTEADDRRGTADAAVAVISHAFWQRRYGGARDVVGRTITLDRVPFTIVGVTPPGFTGPDVGRAFDVAVPIAAEALLRGKANRLDSRSDWWLHVMVRLRRGQTPEQATAALRAVQRQIADESRPTTWRPDAAARFLADPFTLRPAATGTSRLRLRYERPLVTLTAVVGLTLLVACGNIANLLLARAAARRHELSVRTALGASGWRIARQLLAESLLLSTTGAVLGVAVAVAGSRVVVAQLSTNVGRTFLDVGIDPRMLAFTAAVAVGTALLFGTVPALRAARAAPIDAMKEQGRGTSRRAGVAGTLVVTQVALSFVLLVGAGLFLRTFASLAARDLGFERGRALLVSVDARRAGLDSAALRATWERVREAALAVPGVARAGLSAITPVSGDTRNNIIALPGRPPLPERERLVMMNVVSPGWFATLGTPLVAGRDFDGRDRPGAPLAVIVNRAFVAKYFGGERPIGRLIAEVNMGTAHPDRPPMEIVGVVGDAVYESPREQAPPTMYWPLAQERAPSGITLTLRAAPGVDPAALARSVGAALLAVHPDLTLSFRPFRDVVDASLVQERLLATLSGFFGALALLLAALGLYGVTAYAVTRRHLELGIRMALGTTPAGAVRLVLARVAGLVAAGLALGLLGSWWAARFVESLLYGLPPRDLVTTSGAAAVLMAVGALAGWVPARRAARIDPMRVLREG